MIEASLCMDTIRRGVVDLATSERLDKESALHVTRLFHATEMLLRAPCTVARQAHCQGHRRARAPPHEHGARSTRQPLVRAGSRPHPETSEE